MCWGLRMLNDLVGAGAVYIACGYAALRHWYSKFLFSSVQRYAVLPCGYRQDWIKRLYWEEDGFVLVTKRLEAGSFQWPRTAQKARRLSYQQYPLIVKSIENDNFPGNFSRQICKNKTNTQMNSTEW